MSRTIALFLLGLTLGPNVDLLFAQSVGKTRPSLAQFSEALVELAQLASPAVVQINVRGRSAVSQDSAKKAGYVAEQSGSGSGVIVDTAGYIVTNAHVVSEARSIDVSVGDKSGDHKHFPAKLVGIDKETDLAVLRIEAAGLTALQFADSAALKQGQLVMAIGSPLGLDNSATVGYVSATARYLDPENPVYYIQTDASINPGNSGGALLDINGRLAGINTLIITQSGGNEGIGFAIPSNTVRQVYEGIRKSGRIRRGAIGALAQDISPTLASALGLEQESGVILSDIVPHGAAEAAGLECGDLVLAVDGKPLHHSRDLIAAVYHRNYGEEIQLEILRGKEKMSKTVAVLQRPHRPSDLAELASREAHLIRRLGVLALTLDEKVTPILPDLRRLSGVVVAGIPLEFAALNPGLAPGDVIYEANGVRISSLEGLRAWLDTKKAKAPIAFLVERSGQLIYVPFELE